jgi:hypothetical protein
MGSEPKETTMNKRMIDLVEVAYINAKGQHIRHVVYRDRLVEWWAKQEAKGCEMIASCTAYPFAKPGRQTGVLAPV